MKFLFLAREAIGNSFSSLSSLQNEILLKLMLLSQQRDIQY